jgi:hypothetical protein
VRRRQQLLEPCLATGFDFFVAEPLIVLESGMIYPPPGFDTKGLSEAEELEALHLWDLLDVLAQFTLDFEAALDLLDVAESMQSESLQRRSGWGPAIWPFVPARDAAVTLFQFGWVLDTSITDALRRCPTFRAKVDHEKLKAVRREFDAAFPTHVSLRHAVGHAAQLNQTRENIQRHAAPSKHFGAGRAFMRGNLMNRTLIYSNNGVEASVAITRETLATLERFTTETFEAFAPVSWPNVPDPRFSETFE